MSLPVDHVHMYWAALGRFVASFAALENQIQLTLRHYTGVTDPIAQAVFSGVKAETGIGFIKRLHEALMVPDEDCEMLNHAALHLGKIRRIRNDLLHYGATYDTGGVFIISNRLVALTEKRIIETKITAGILDNMSYDLGMIEMRLFWLTFDAKKRQRYSKGANQVLTAAWLYRPNE